MSTNEISINRDLDADVLYVIKTNAEKDKTVNISINADITARADANGVIVGLTIEDFSRVMSHLKDQDDYILMEKFEGILEFLNASNLVPTGH